MSYKDYRSDKPKEVKVMDLDFFTPTRATIGRRDKDKELLGAYLLYHYLQEYADDFAKIGGHGGRGGGARGGWGGGRARLVRGGGAVEAPDAQRRPQVNGTYRIGAGVI